MPADLREPVRELQDLLDRAAGAEVLHVVKPRAAKALRIEFLQLMIFNMDWNQRDAYVIALARLDEVRGGGVVVAVRRRLHHHAALDAQVRVEREQRFLGRIGGRRVAALGRIGEALARSKDMEMRVAGAAREPQPGLARARME